jgi:DNA polymerase-1
MLRLACCLATEAGIEVCAPVHDAVLICAPVDQLDAEVERMRDCMARASRAVLDRFELRAGVEPVRYPNRYRDPRGGEMWDRVIELLEAQQAKKRAA